MIDALMEIVSFIGMLIDFVIQLVVGLFTLLLMIPKVVGILTSSFGLLPSFLVGFASITITTCVIFIILGRNGGGEK